VVHSVSYYTNCSLAFVTSKMTNSFTGHHLSCNLLDGLKTTADQQHYVQNSKPNFTHIGHYMWEAHIKVSTSLSKAGSNPDGVIGIFQSHNSSNWLRWSRGSVLAFGNQVRGFKLGRSRRIFKGEKILSTPSFGGEVKSSVPCRRFAACKRSLELRGSRILRRNLSGHFSPTNSSTFRC